MLQNLLLELHLEPLVTDVPVLPGKQTCLKRKTPDDPRSSKVKVVEAPPQALEGRTPDDQVLLELLEILDPSELCQLEEEEGEADRMTLCCDSVPLVVESCPKRKANKTSDVDAVDELFGGS